MSREIKSPEAAILTEKSFDGKHEIQFNEKSHRYKWVCPCHLKASSVGTTTFLKSTYPTSIGLINWMKHQTSIALYESLSQNHFANTWPVDEEQKKTIFKQAETAHEGVAQEAADIGTILHGFGEFHSLGKAKEADELLEKVKGVEKWPVIKSCIDKYLDWDSQKKGKLHLAEALVASPTHLYCGKIDRLDETPQGFVLRDYKTSKAIFLEQKLQLVAYRMAIKEWLGLDVTAIEIVRFGKEDGAFETELVNDPVALGDLEDQVIRLRKTYSFVQQYGK